jgi:hypothetical protein
VTDIADSRDAYASKKAVNIGHCILPTTSKGSTRTPLGPMIHYMTVDVMIVSISINCMCKCRMNEASTKITQVVARKL